ncbi:MAG: family 43 glycosylhydrolase [Kiritimatiellia bacterium]
MKTFVLGIAVACACGALGARQAEIRPGAVWHDTAGHVINAHGCGVMFDRGVYWWYGEHKVYGRAGNKAHVGVHVYSSTDLMNWDDRGVALAVSEDPASDIVDGCVIERPKVIRCAKTGRYVMFFHLELKGRGYEAARVGIAVAERPEGPFAFQRSLRPNGAMSRDMTLFVDDDGKAYHIFASEENRTTHIDELTEDCLDYTGKSWRMAVDESTEAQAICKQGGWYYLIGSGCTGWRPNKARLYRARKLEGPWENLGNPCRGTCPETGLGPDITWGAQSCFLLPVAGRAGEVIAMFDIWHPANHEESRYVWLPVTFEADRLWIDWRTAWRPTVASPPKAPPMRFMTFNIWGDYFKNPVAERDEGVAEVIVRERPDFVALQEVTQSWYGSRLFKKTAAAGYALVRGDEDMALYRAGAPDGLKTGATLGRKNWCNHEPLLYNAARFAMLDSGVEFYHLALQVEKSVTWGLFEDRESGRRLIAFATHFWWKQGLESETHRELNARRLVEVIDRVKAKWGDLPVIGGGDLNCEFGAAPHRVFEVAGYLNAAQKADVRDARPTEHGDPVRNAEGKYEGHRVVKGDAHATYLDHVYYTPAIHATRHAVCADPLALSVSDHSPVVVDFEL